MIFDGKYLAINFKNFAISWNHFLWLEETHASKDSVAVSFRTEIFARTSNSYSEQWLGATQRRDQGKKNIGFDLK